ncbi:MAG: hypothetical protein IRY99_20570, partial [Isosphaeraceae bacterium]|nr:hypothetical protein [Isosphaeraceae bacterium]
MIAILRLVLVAASLGADPSKPLPISAHNCYPLNGQGRERLIEALELGIDNIEIDLGWDEKTQRLIVSHDATPRPGVVYPEFEDYLVPALEAHWRTPRPDGAPTVLTIDWKTAEPRAVARFKQFLDAHPDWFSTAPKAQPSPLTARRLTVCLTGEDRAKEAYDALVPPGDPYRAFRDRVFGAGDYREDIKDYAREPASPYFRFLTLHWGNIERGGPPRAGEWTAEEAARLKGLVAHTHQQGYRLRFYCLVVPSP